MTDVAMRLGLRTRASRLGGSRRLLLFAVVLGAAGTALWVLPLSDVHQLRFRPDVPWWALLAACYACSVLYVPLAIHRTSSTLSFTAIPVSVGLFLVDPRMLLGCYLVGVLLGNWTRRGVRPVIDMSNLLLDTLYIAVTVLVFNLVGPNPADPLSARSLLALAAAMGAAGGVIGPVAVNTGVLLYQGSIDRAATARAMLMEAGATLTNTSLGLVLLALLLSRPLIALALVPTIAVVFVGQLAASEGQRRAQRMEFLYKTNDLLHSSLHMTERYNELLEACARTFAMERAELIVIPESREPALRFFAANGPSRTGLASSLLTFAEQEMLNVLRDHRVLSGSRSMDTSPIGLLLAERNADEGTVALLRGHERLLGMIVLLDPVEGRNRMSAQESNMLATVAGQVSVALENGQLSDAVRTMAAEKDELARKALHDPLTQLPNRSLFTQTVDQALAKLSRSGRYLAVAFIDLDDFKQVNDTHGHAAGDQVLCCVASRLRQQVRKHDLAARLAGDEFALLLDGLRQPEDARVVAERVVESLLAPMPLDGLDISVGGSVGIAIVSDYRDAAGADELLRRADMAMYLAKRQGKGRFMVFDAAAREPVIVAGSAETAREMEPAIAT